MRVDGAVVGNIERGLVVLVGCGEGDVADDARYIAEKVAHLRVFEDEAGKMNLSVLDIVGEVLVISQFTLYGDCRKGRRPSFTGALAPDEADRLIAGMAEHLTSLGLKVEEGQFGAKMSVSLTNDGPVTILLDSTRAF